MSEGLYRCRPAQMVRLVTWTLALVATPFAIRLSLAQGQYWLAAVWLLPLIGVYRTFTQDVLWVRLYADEFEVALAVGRVRLPYAKIAAVREHTITLRPEAVPFYKRRLRSNPVLLTGYDEAWRLLKERSGQIGPRGRRD